MKLTDQLRALAPPDSAAPPDPTALLIRFQAEHRASKRPALALTALLLVVPIVSIGMHRLRPTPPAAPLTRALETWSAHLIQQLESKP